MSGVMESDPVRLRPPPTPRTQGQAHDHEPQKEHTRRNQRRQKTREQPKPNRAKRDATPNLRCSDTKKPKTISDSNEYRRRRNLNNLLMINRLETNIGRMEARLQELGFDLGDDGIAAAPSMLGRAEDAQFSPASSVSDFDTVLNEATSESNPEDVYAELMGPPPTSDIPSINRNTADFRLPTEQESPLPKPLTGFFIPRCLLDTPAPESLEALSQEGTEWMGQKAGLAPSLPPNYHHVGADDGLFHDLFSPKSFCPLPSKEETLSLIHEYLQNFNSLCPLYQKSKLLLLFSHDNLDTVIQNPARWASVNVVLALGIMLRINDRSLGQPDHQKSWLYMKNALAVLNDLCISPPSLWSIQALLGMATFLLGTTSAQPCSFLVSTAIRMSHQIGLERTDGDSALYPEELEQRRRVFWIAYCLDRDMSLRFDRPLAQNDDDMSVNLPTENPTETTTGIMSTERQSDFDAFRACCQLAIIKGQLYKHLYSVAAKDRPLDQIIASVGMLDERLQQWKKNLPSKYQPESQSLPIFPQSQISVFLLFLHYSYFNCMIAIHRLVAYRGVSIGIDLAKDSGVYIPFTPPCNSRIFMSASLCASAARASINLMRYMPAGNTCLVGILIHYPIVALMTLSSTIVQNPRDTSRAYDMRLIGQVEKFLSFLVVSIPNEGINQLAKYCAHYRSAAEAAIEKAMQFCTG